MHSPSAEVKGVEVDDESRCAHYHSERDIIAIKMKCCGEYYACKDCHDELAGHKQKPGDARTGISTESVVGTAGQN